MLAQNLIVSFFGAQAFFYDHPFTGEKMVDISEYSGPLSPHKVLTVVEAAKRILAYKRMMARVAAM